MPPAPDVGYLLRARKNGQEKAEFIGHLREFAQTLTEYVSTNSGDWSIKGFIDADKNIHAMSADTKVISKILEIQLFPRFRSFAASIGYDIIPAEKQNWHPDLFFVKKSDTNVKFAVDIKTTYRLDGYKNFCNGFTLGSHGEYFKNRKSSKNVQFPYGDYLAHLSLGVLYTRAAALAVDETKVLEFSELSSIDSVIKDLIFFAEEKWKMASDRTGSGNTANIGSINHIPDLLSGNGVFAKLGENIFDGFWVNQGVLEVPDPKKTGQYKKLARLSEFLEFKGMDTSLTTPRKPRKKDAGQ